MERIVRVLAGVAEGLGLRATARVVAVDPHTVLPWLVEAAEPLRALSGSCLCEGHGKPWQRDAGYAVLRAVKNGALSEDEAIQRREHAPSWGWTALDPESTLRVVLAGGARTLAMAQGMVHQGAQV